MLGYKFRSNIDIRQDTFSLLENKIYASKLAQLNDPFEATILNYVKDFTSEKVGSEELNTLFTRIKDEVGIYSLSIDKEEQKAVLDELMWAHYANSHKGFCIEYDIDTLMNSLRLDMLDSVDKYSVKYNDIDINTFARERAGKDPKETLLSFKSPRWKYENEVRLVFDNSGIKSYDPKALKSIYFGLKMSPKDKEIIMKGLEGVNVKFYDMIAVSGKYKLQYNQIVPNDAYIQDLLPKSMYEIIGTPEVLKTVQNFNVLFKDKDKSKNMLEYFVSKFRNEYAYKPSNITIVDDMQAIELLDSRKNPKLSPEQEKFLAEHWIAYSSFDASDYVWMYPSKQL